ncbi:class I SAM-dependent methyltransferase [Nonomuraea rhizosphaerae]|uniref:class I SAM-dependent methyltransferase n=1 Tax=Nonomuraea rhizosphaerae TaxID=2665663 RepID=UPI001C5ED65D|nr:class I SAM-dependent methyltransferase [Nonomuraea rhizosphaerae]
MLDYDAEAGHYDETRGGLPRASAAADAVCGLVRPFVPGGTLLDVACGTGLVSRELARRGLRVLGVDASAGMAGIAAGRIGVALGDSRRLPVRDASVDVVTTIWLLHLLPDARPVIAECARVLRPGGIFVTTVDKRASHGTGGSRTPSDQAELVVAIAAAHGLRACGEATFVGHGQGGGSGPDPVFRLLAFGG